MNANEIPTNANPLDLDYSGVDFKRPLLPGNMPYELTVRKCALQQYDKGDHVGDPYIYIELTNAQPVNAPDGVIAPGAVVIFDRINLKAYGKATMAMVNEQVGRFQQALGIPGPVRQAIAGAQGRVVKANVRLDPAGSRNGKTFPEKNSIGYYMKA